MKIISKNSRRPVSVTAKVTTKATTKATVATALLAAAGLLLASCADDADSQTEAGPASAEASQSNEDEPSPTSEEQPRQLDDVDPATFEIAGNHMFRYVLDGESGECSISERGAMCMGTAGDDIPEVQVPPFPQRPASAVSVGVDGTEYLIFEGGPPAPATLEAGQRVSVGDSTCSVPDDSTLTCEYGGDSFTLDGADALISTSAEPVGRYFVGGAGGAGGEAGGASTPGSTGKRVAGESCGTSRSSEFPGFDGKNVEVRKGPVDCGEAMGILDEYLDTPTDAHHGNANIRQYGDWNCAMPSYGSAQESGFSLTCSGPDGVGFGIRNE